MTQEGARHDSPGHDQSRSEAPMSDYNLNALTALRLELKTKVVMKPHLIDILEIPAGGFMTAPEAQSVRNAESPMEQLIIILLGKGDTEFDIFCDMLQKSNYCAWAVKLKQKAVSLRTGDQKEDCKAVVTFVRPVYDVERNDRRWLRKAIKEAAKNRKPEPDKLMKTLYLHTYTCVAKILEKYGAEHIRDMVTTARTAIQLGLAEGDAEALTSTLTVTDVLCRLSIPKMWNNTDLLEEIVSCLPEEARTLAMSLVDRYMLYLDVYDDVVSVQDSLTKDVAEATEEQISVEVTVTKDLSEFTRKDCKEILHLLLLNSWNIPRNKSICTEARSVSSTTVVFLIDKAFIGNMIQGSVVASSLWAFQELGVTKVVIGVFELNVVQLLAQHFKEALRSGLTGNVDFVDAIKTLPYQVYALVDPDTTERLLMRGAINHKIVRPRAEQAESVPGTAGNEGVEPTPENDECNIQPKLEEEAKCEGEEKMKEVTDSVELLSCVQDLEDKLEDSEQEKITLQYKLKTSQEEEGRVRQEIASLKEKLVSVLSSQEPVVGGTGMMSKKTAGHGGRPMEEQTTAMMGTSRTPIDTSKLTDFLPAMGPKWFEIALKLGCKDMAMELMYSMEPAPRLCFMVIDGWMNKGGKIVCWEYLCREVLRSEGVGLHHLADQIERELGLDSTRKASPQSGGSTEPTVADDSKMKDSAVDADTLKDPSDLTVGIQRSDSDMGGGEPPYCMLCRRIKHICDNPDTDVWESVEEQDRKIAIVLTDYFLRHHELGTEIKKVSLEVGMLQKEDILPDEMKKLAMDEFDQYEKQMSDDSSNSHTVSSLGAPEEEPLFSKENVYHALVCCQAVDASDESQVRSILRELSHSFDGLSVTRSDCKERHQQGKHHGMYIIARKADGTYIVAFRGIPALSAWLTYSSFEEGISKQAGSVPGKYFLHLIRSGSRIVFTGFAMGGAIAGAVVSRMLADSYMNKEVLESRVACITFGHPLVADCAQQDLVEKGGLSANCLHNVYLQEDTIPVLLRYAFVQQKAVLKPDKETGAVGKVSHSSLMLSKISTVQKACAENPVARGSREPSKKVADAIDWTREKVEDMTKRDNVKKGKPPLPCGQYYLVQPVPKKGADSFVWESLSREEAEGKLSCLSKHGLTCLNQDTFKKHAIKNYFRGVLSAYIGSQESYMLPDVKAEDLKPLVTPGALAVKSVDLHCYSTEAADTEVCAILFGSNLWFTSDVCFHDVRDLDVCLQANTALEVQARSIINQDVASFIKDLPGRGTVHVGSCFLPASAHDVEVHAKNFSISHQHTRVAKLAPVQLIALSVLSMVLERAGQDSTPSEQLCAARAFLKAALETVPAEGLLIAACNVPPVDTFFRQLIPSFISDHIQLYPSQVMLNSIENYIFGTVLNHKLHGTILALLKQMLPKDARNVMDQPRPLFDEQCRHYLDTEVQNIRKALPRKKNLPALCGEGLKSLLIKENDPIRTVQIMREKVECIAARQEDQYSRLSQDSSQAPCNKAFLEVAKEVNIYALRIASILDSFMSMQMQVPFVRTCKATAEAMDRASNTEEGSGDVWGQVGWKHIVSQMEVTKLGSPEMKPLLVNMSDYLGRYLDCHDKIDSMGYSSKVHFVCSTMSNAVSYSQRYISYSLELQLKALCEERGITASTPIMEIHRHWADYFKDTALSQVAPHSHPIIARWIKWMLITHQLREKMAERTTLGIIGLMNSGKSHLLNCLFQTKAPTGTLEEKGTTIPLVYTMDPAVRLLSVIDFPGVDDCDDFIQNLCLCMLEMVQVAVFVVDYRKASSDSSMAWLRVLARAGIPVLVCLTHADKLVAELMPRPGVVPDSTESKTCVEDKRQEFRLKYRECFSTSPPECAMACFTFDKDSIFASSDGPRLMAKAGIEGASFVASWTQEQLNRLGLQSLAESLREFFHAKKVL